uniref:DUF721 domain-containing protein n=1 Tax=Schlesneria paludicola TaxID=360056 RepID=A0A7C4QT32_9PLAN
MSDPVPLAQALTELIALRGLARRQADTALQEAWAAAAGPAWAPLTRPGRIVRGVLQVEVASSALLGELTAFHGPELTRRLQQAAPHLRIKGIRFRLTGA